ncbi:protein FAR1-RELATED SEQUENCE 2-like [Helianthus annuus]|uniref:protein FAR1-RELATED SEQUENCE 2-like n=1 Tax=Helianthus annuus TaxID=4232 RepID=UPI000B8FD85F|nr:protein FAR1-RELATED SEQUENCE 2-like [Helianthus annuus]
MCTRAGIYKDKNVDTLDSNQKERLVRSNFSKRTDCGALLCVIFEAGSWKVYKFVEQHNHDLVERPDMHFLPTERHLTQLQKHVIHNMSKLNLGPVKAFNVMKTCFGSFEDVDASKVEFKNYKRYAMVFVPFTGIDNHHCNVTFGAALLASETADMYIWLLRVFLKAICSQPKVVVTNQDPAMKKAISTVGVRLCNSTNFKERICGAVRTDILIPEEESWIPAYHRMEELSGLMRTTSRPESEDHFFLSKAQCHTHRKNDHESRYKRSQLKSNYQVLEGQAADIYTKNIFCDVQVELIGIAYCINQRYEDQPDGFVKFYINDFQQPCTSLYEVMYRKSDWTCSCSCRRFEQSSLLCRHIFYVLRSLDIREFPKQYILNRWRKEASPNCSFEYSISREYMTELDPDVQSMVQDTQIVALPASTRDRFVEITGQNKNDKNPIRVPVGYKSKGFGSRKRLKSKHEIAIKKMKSKLKPGAKERQC